MTVVPLLRSRELGYLLNAVALGLLAALAVRYQMGYVPRFFAVAFAIAVVAVGLSVSAVLARRSGKSIFDLLLSAAVASSVLMAANGFTGFMPIGAFAVYRQHEDATAKLYRHSLPGDLELFLGGFDKSSLQSFSNLPKRAGGYVERWRPALEKQGFSERQARAVGLMLFTSTLWAFGNQTHPDKVGCITENEDNQWRQQAPNLETVKRARIGCCNDYAHALSLLLSRHGFENRYVVIPGHIFNEAKIDGRWHVLDANTNLFITSAWNEASTRNDVAVHAFPHPGTESGKLYRPILARFQSYVANMVLIGPLLPGSLKQGRPPAPDGGKEPGILYKVLVDFSV